jgi:ligand-binding SRPBCC domain-containing protein
LKVYSLVRKQRLPYPREYVFSFFKNPENLAYITPDSLGFKILTPSPIEMRVGTLIDYTIRWLGVPVRWRTLITRFKPPVCFVDEQIKGPYSFWHHTHTFTVSDEGMEMTDEVRYALSFGVLGELLHKLVIRRQLEVIFDYRAKVIVGLLDRGFSRYKAFIQAGLPHETIQ